MDSMTTTGSAVRLDRVAYYYYELLLGLHMIPLFPVLILLTDTPQFRGRNPYFFSENPYQSVSFIYASMYHKCSRNSYHDAVMQKNGDIVYNKNRQPAAKNQNRSFTSRGATVRLGLESTPLID